MYVLAQPVQVYTDAGLAIFTGEEAVWFGLTERMTQLDALVPFWLGKIGSCEQQTEMGFDPIDRHVFRPQSRCGQPWRNLVRLGQGTSPCLHAVSRILAVQIPGKERVPERLQTVDAALLTFARTFPDDPQGRFNNLCEAGTDLLQKTRTTGHRVVQQGIGALAPGLPDDQDLEVFPVHIEDFCRANATGPTGGRPRLPPRTPRRR